MIMKVPAWQFPGIFLGWEKPKEKGVLGFQCPPPAPPPKKKRDRSDQQETPITYHGDGHLMTFAPTGGGKGRGQIIPTLLSYPGSVIVIDPKCENYRVTARHRREMGQRVIVLDPFQKVTTPDSPSDQLNPFDVFRLPGMIADADATMLAWQLAAGNSFAKDPFWDNSGTSFLAGLISHVATGVPDADRNLCKVLGYLYADDVIYNLAVLLDSKTVVSKHAYRELAAFLQLPERDTRPSVLATAASWVKSLNSDCVEATLTESTFSLLDLMNGEPMTIYLCVPPDKLHSHKSLLRLWIATLLTSVVRRERRPEQSTLFILDECAQLGNMPLLETAVTLLRGYGLQVWSFWQDPEQIQSLYPTSHSTLINNSAVLQTFGITSHQMAEQVSKFVDIAPEKLLQMNPADAAVFIKGQRPQVNRRGDYLHDQAFEDIWDPNPFFPPTSRKDASPRTPRFRKRKNTDSSNNEDHPRSPDR
jgi:type IV secretion system protein VirD4